MQIPGPIPGLLNQKLWGGPSAAAQALQVIWIYDKIEGSVTSAAHWNHLAALNERCLGLTQKLMIKLVRSEARARGF